MLSLRYFFWWFVFLIFLAGAPDLSAQPFIKGVYGNPAALLKAGYTFDALGMNAVFVRSGSLNRDFFNTARSQGCRVYVEFPTLYGKDYLKNHPDAWPINEAGEKAPDADWFMGICPTHPGFKAYRAEQLRAILRDYDVDGIFLDYLHWHAQFETPHPILPRTCFCDRCTGLFAAYSGRQIPGADIPARARWIMDNAQGDWWKWRNSILNTWVTDMKSILRASRPKALLGVYYCAWYPSDHDSALYRTLGIDVAGLAERADVLAPMLFHQMKARPVEWVGEYVQWLGKWVKANKSGTPKIWPIVQAHNSPGIVSPEEFRKVMLLGAQAPSSGIMMFSGESIAQDPQKVAVMRDLYLKGLKQ
jgi:uncharacterized lipoprotein YddW (UPF0748 family)